MGYRPNIIEIIIIIIIILIELTYGYGEGCREPARGLECFCNRGLHGAGFGVNFKGMVTRTLGHGN